MQNVEFYGGILTSPMTNAHCHLELSYLRGAIPSGGGFAGFAKSIGQVRNIATMEQRIASAEFWDAKMYSEGIGRVLDISNGATTLDIKRRSKIDYHTFAELFGLGATSIEPLKELMSLAEGTNISITPHSTYSLNEAAFRAAVAASGDAPLSIHFMESRAESDLYHRRGTLWQWYEGSGMKVDFLHYGSPTARIIECIPANRKIYLIHNTFLERADAVRLMEHFGDNLTFVLCPCSNKFIEGVLPDALMLTELGARIALGTDSLASAENLSLTSAMALLEDIPLQSRLGWVSRGVEVGAKGLVLIENLNLTQLSMTEHTTSRRLI